MAIDELIPLSKPVYDLAALARIQQRTLTQDPDHPVVKTLQDKLRMRSETRIWHTLVYLAFMRLPSAHEFWSHYQDPEDISDVEDIPERLVKLPTGFERRGLRVPANMRRHIGELLAMRHRYGSFRNWLEMGFGADTKENWLQLQENLQLVFGNGRWAAYNTGELLMNINDFDVLPGDMGMEGSSGPRWGLAMIFGDVPGNSAKAIDLLNRQAEILLKMLNERFDCGLRIDELETVLCDFHSMFNGQHYIGHYTDLLQTQLHIAEGDGIDVSEIWEARQFILPAWSLGEFNGWNGERKDLLNCYRQHNEVEWWKVYDYPFPEEA